MLQADCCAGVCAQKLLVWLQGAEEQFADCWCGFKEQRNSQPVASEFGTIKKQWEELKVRQWLTRHSSVCLDSVSCCCSL